MSKEIQAQLFEQFVKILQQENLEYNRHDLVRFIYDMTQLKDIDVMKLLDTLKCMHENSIQHRDYIQEQERKIRKEKPHAWAFRETQNQLDSMVPPTLIPCKFPPAIRLPEMGDTRKHYVNSNGEFFNRIGYLDSFVKYYNSALVILLLYLEKLDEINKQKQREGEEFKKRIEEQRRRRREQEEQRQREQERRRQEEHPRETDYTQSATSDILNCPSAFKTPAPCASRNEYIKQSLIFHPDKNSGCIKDSTRKFQILRNMCEDSKGGKRKRRRTNKKQKKNKTKRNKK